jgi:hypothetical protein
LAHLLASGLHLLVLNTASKESRAVLVGHVFIDEESKDLTILNTHISNIFVIGIEIAILYLNGTIYLTSRRNLG